MSVHTVYQHLTITNTPTQFQIKTIKEYKPNISRISSDGATIDTPNTSTNEENEVKGNETNDTILIHYPPTFFRMIRINKFFIKI